MSLPLLAYIPFLQQPTVRIGPITLAAFGLIVASAVATGLTLGERRFRAVGLDGAIGERMAWWVIAGGFLGAHLFSVLVYFPREVAANPLVLLELWKDISSFGGMIGGGLGVWLFFRLRARDVDRRTRRAYLDVVAFVFPVSLMIGRLACSLAHDHPGTITSFPLAVSLRSPEAQRYIADVYRDGGRLAELPGPEMLTRLAFHDLGWYEFLYLASVVVPLTLWLGRRRRKAGTFLLIFIALYMPVRFLLDFLRVSDVRYAGLTPGQWMAIVALLALPALHRRFGTTIAAAPEDEAGSAGSPDQRGAP
jgi:phosphatidylglycerol:prolipoprotein diacylglycerol transferase